MTTKGRNLSKLVSADANLLVDVNQLQTDVGGLQTDVGGLQTDVGGLQTDVGGLQTNINSLDGSDVAYDNTGLPIVATNLQGAVTELIRPAGSIIQVEYVRIDERISYSVPYAPPTTEMTELAVSITPKKSNSLIHAQFFIQGEGTDHNIGFRVRVDGSEPSDGYNTEAGDERFSFLTSANYDGNTDSTPRLEIVNYFHLPGSTNTVTYSPSVGDSGGTSTFRMNRTAGSTGATNHEVGVSWGIVYEISQ